MRLTVFCPDAMIDYANHFLAVLFPESLALDLLGIAGWQDHSGTHFSVASLCADVDWLGRLEQRFERPWWDDQRQINMETATRVRDGLKVLTPDPQDMADLQIPSDCLCIVAAPDHCNVLLSADLVPIPEVVVHI